MATYNKFEAFSERVAEAGHQLDTDVLKQYLSNTTPDAAADVVKADLAEITAANGYPSGGTDMANSTSRSGGTTSVVTVDVVFTASGGSFGPWRYWPFYNDTQTTPGADPLIGWWDYGTAETTLDTETATADYGASIFTLA